MNLSSLSYYLLPNSADSAAVTGGAVHPLVHPSVCGTPSLQHPGVQHPGAISRGTALNSPVVAACLPSQSPGVAGSKVGNLAGTNNIINLNPKLIAPASVSAKAVMSLPITPVEHQNCSSLLPPNASTTVNKRTSFTGLQRGGSTTPTVSVSAAQLLLAPHCRSLSISESTLIQPAQQPVPPPVLPPVLPPASVQMSSLQDNFTKYPPAPKTNLPPSSQPLTSMQYRSLGKTGLRLSCLGLGTFATFANQIDDETAEKLVKTAFENGVNYFDTAELYAGGKAEILLGKILSKNEWRRSSYVIATKLYWGGKSVTEIGLSRKHIIEGMHASLERLQLKNVDIVFANKSDANTPMEEVVRAFTWLIEQGKTYYWGTCRWTPAEIMEAYCVARQFNLIPPVCDQSEYHMFQRTKIETQMPELYHKIGVGAVTWSPLASGILTNKYKNGVPNNSRASLKAFHYLKGKIASKPSDDGIQQHKLDELDSIAKKLGCTSAQLAIGWCLKNEGISCVLLGASTVDQLKENLHTLKILHLLTPKVIQEIEKILVNKPCESRLFDQGALYLS